MLHGEWYCQRRTTRFGIVPTASLNAGQLIFHVRIITVSKKKKAET